jgi:hypothetical protein
MIRFMRATMVDLLKAVFSAKPLLFQTSHLIIGGPHEAGHDDKS